MSITERINEIEDVLGNLAFNNGRGRVRRTLEPSKVRPSSNSRTSKVLEQQYAFLEKISKNSDSSVGIRIIKVMRLNLKDAELQLRAIVGFRKLMIEPGNEVTLARMGAGLAVLTAMSRHPKEATLLEQACGAIGSLCEEDEVGDMMLRHGALQTIIRALEAFPDDDRVVAEALVALTNLHASRPDRMTLLFDFGVSNHIVHALQKFPKSARVQGDSFGAIGWLQIGFYRGQNLDKKQLKALRKEWKRKHKKDKLPFKDFYALGVTPMILAGMKRFPKDINVQVQGVTAITAVTHDKSKRVEELVKGDGIEISKSAIKRFPDDPTLLESMFGFVKLLATSKKGQKLGFKADIIPNIIDALEEFTEPIDENLQFEGILALHGLCYKFKKAAKEMAANKGVEAAIRAEKLYPENDILCKKARELKTLIIRGGSLK